MPEGREASGASAGSRLPLRPSGRKPCGVAARSYVPFGDGHPAGGRRTAVAATAWLAGRRTPPVRSRQRSPCLRKREPLKTALSRSMRCGDLAPLAGQAVPLDQPPPAFVTAEPVTDRLTARQGPVLSAVSQRPVPCLPPQVSPGSADRCRALRLGLLARPRRPNRRHGPWSCDSRGPDLAHQELV
jgi:hypothetical protein